MNGDLYAIISLVVLAVTLLGTLAATTYGLMTSARLARRGHQAAALTGASAILIPSLAALSALPLLVVGIIVLQAGLDNAWDIIEDLIDQFASFSQGVSAMLCFALASILPFALVLHLVARDSQPPEVE